MGNERVLVISDTHAPYNHRDLVRFLAAVRDRYSPTRIIHIGDEIDAHALSFHEHDPDLLSPGHELARARARLLPIFKMFPVVDVLESNHGSLVYRRARASGIPNASLKSYREILEAPAGWKWHREVFLRLPDGNYVCFQHGKGANPLKWGQSIAMNTVNGHHHGQFSIQYWRTPRGLFWSMVVGCLIDDFSRAFEYNKIDVYRPLLGVGMILNSHPLLVPMTIGKAGRWTGKLP